MENQIFELRALERRTRKLERRLRLPVSGWLLTIGLMTLSS
ncbi:MAG TPA: hypothetical protein VGC76_01475 [Pyrinomonadaceae bacterium]|jgi:hypothetical protein